jgi:hypothetical protein
MKKLYYLDESEKERILNLHNKHKGNLLNEDEDESINWSGDVDKKCEKYTNIKPTLPTKTITQVVQGLRSNAKSFGYASLAAVKNIKDFLRMISTTADFCAVKRSYKKNYTSELLDDLRNKFAFIESWRNTVKIPINDILEDYNENITASSGQNAAQSKEGVTNFEACLKANTLLTKTEGSAWYSYTFNGKIYNYAKDGDWYSTDTNRQNRDPQKVQTYYKFTCDATNKIIPTKDTTNTTETNKQPNTGSGTSGQKIAGGYVLPNAFTPEKVSAIKTAVGSTDKSGSLTQDDINKLYAKLSQK